MANLDALNREIAKLARRANARIERAGEGQRAAITSYQDRSRLEINSDICYGAAKFEIRDRRETGERTD